jgi:diadenylate cyclase
LFALNFLQEIEHFIGVFRSIQLKDVIDILVVAFLIYRILLLLQGTKALQMLAGLTVIILLYFFSEILELLTLNWILHTFMSSLLILIIIVFQDDIRRLNTHLV